MPDQSKNMTCPNVADGVLLSIENSIATLTLNSASTRNSLDGVMVAALNARLDDVWAVRDELKGLLLCADGDHFMVGGDIRYFESLLGAPQALHGGIGTLIADFNKTVSRIDALPFPVIALVQGAVAGAGLSLALTCDMIVAADDARFVMAYSALGATPDGGGSWQLPRRVGQQRAMHMFLFNEALDADRAFKAGLVAQVVERAALAHTRDDMARRLAGGSRLAQNAGKALMRSGRHADLATALENERAQFLELAVHADFDEGVKAFIQKRAPRFTL